MHSTQNSQRMGRLTGLGGIFRRMATLCLLTAASAHAAVFHVDAASPAPAPDGASWATAYPDLQSAVDAADSGDEVWVRAGVYRSTTDPVLTLRVGVAVYGGFDGTESARDQRDWAGRPTVLDGEGLRRCVLGADTAVLDGFTVTRGRADYGGGMHNRSCSPTVANCLFLRNRATADGGAVDNYYGSPVFKNCLFVDNLAGWGGGGIKTAGHSNTTTVRNCVFTRNMASHGGAISSHDGAPVVTNSILWGNDGGYYKEVHHYSLYGTEPSITYCCVEGGYTGTGNISEDPLFVGADNGGVQLREGSPCVDAGSADGAPALDYLGRPRPAGGGVDMGAYEGVVAPGDVVELTVAVTPAWGGMTYPYPGAYSFARGDTVWFLVDHGNRLGFARWEGDAAGTATELPVTLTGDTQVTAVFEENIFHVDAASTAADPDGRSWDAAYPDLQSAVDAARKSLGGEVWTRAGVYTGLLEGAVVAMREGVVLYGGFAGDESSPDGRDWKANPSVIDGEGARRGVLGANHAALDGFTVTRGLATRAQIASYQSRIGGGMLVHAGSPLIANCVFSDNAAEGGGGIGAFTGTLRMSNCEIVNNTANSSPGGGGVLTSSLEAEDCLFSGNRSEMDGGGYSGASLTRLTGCVFSDNAARQSGGGGLFFLPWDNNTGQLRLSTEHRRVFGRILGVL